MPLNLKLKPTIIFYILSYKRWSEKTSATLTNTGQTLESIEFLQGFKEPTYIKTLVLPEGNVRMTSYPPCDPKYSTLCHKYNNTGQML